MNLEPVRPTVRFVAVSEETSYFWWIVSLGLVGAIPWYFLIWGLAQLIRAAS